MPHNETPTGKTILTPRKLVLLATVGAVAGAFLIAGPGNFSLSNMASTQPAQAAERTAPVASQPFNAPTGFADLVAKVKPAVISVRVRIQESMDAEGTSDQQIPPGLQKFFQQFGMPGFQNDMPHGKQMITGLGSGFFISPDGYAVTNNHVVQHAKTVEIKTENGKTYKARVIGTDPKTDLALIKVDSDKTFPYVKFAEHEPRIGDWVVAIGNPFGLSETVTAGIVSAKNRDIGGSSYDDYIQIDAPINKGNSGGPAFNTNGNVIGVNTAIFSPSGGSVGIGFDIPAHTVKEVVAQLKAHGFVNHAYLGVKVQPVSADIADSLGMKSHEGAIVDQPMAGSPAAKAGIKAGDVITAVNGKKIKNARALARTIGMMAPDSEAKIDVLHNGEHKTVTVKLAKLESGQSHNGAGSASSNEVPKLGLTLAPANDVAGAGKEGVAVINVDPNGPAAERGFQSGDVILQVAGKTVSNPGEIEGALKQARASGKHNVLMRVKNANGTRFIAVPTGKA
ncbi:MAG: Do family serine endopeptidase [Pseudolabrys sp.]